MQGGIEALTGKFGGGKSYNATRLCLEHFANGGTCCGNLALKWEGCVEWAARRRRVKLKKEQWIPLEDGQVTTFYEYIPKAADPNFPVYIVLDELALFLQSESYRDTTPQFKSFLPQPRKYGMRILCIIQEFDRLLKQLREYVATRHAFRDANTVESGGIKLNLTLPLFGEMFPYFIHSKYNAKDAKNKKPFSTKWVTKDKLIYSCFDSFHLHGDTPDMASVERHTLEKLPWKPGALEWAAMGGAAAGLAALSLS